MQTQLEIARQGHISDAMKCVAQQENIDPKLVRDELAAGRLLGKVGDIGCQLIKVFRVGRDQVPLSQPTPLR